MQEIDAAVGRAVWDTGIEFGTVGVGDHRMEITTFRADSYDRSFASSRGTFRRCLEGDLVRRDFTTNAMAVRVTAAGPGEFLDRGGLAAAGQSVRHPGAVRVAGDDPLRRAARFVTQLGFAVAPWRVRAAIERR